MNWYTNIRKFGGWKKASKEEGSFLSHLRSKLRDVSRAINGDGGKEASDLIIKEAIDSIRIWCHSEATVLAAEEYLNNNGFRSMTPKDIVLLKMPRDEDGNMSEDTLMDILRGIRPNKEWKALPIEEKEEAAKIYNERKERLDPKREYTQIDIQAEKEGIALKRMAEMGLFNDSLRRRRKDYGRTLKPGPATIKRKMHPELLNPIHRQSIYASSDINNTKTAGYEQSRMKRLKDKIRYALKKKVFATPERRKELMKEMLDVSSEWNVFGKNSWHYEQHRYVAGTNFDRSRGTYNTWLTEDGKIIKD